MTDTDIDDTIASSDDLCRGMQATLRLTSVKAHAPTPKDCGVPNYMDPHHGWEQPCNSMVEYRVSNPENKMAYRGDRAARDDTLRGMWQLWGMMFVSPYTGEYLVDHVIDWRQKDGEMLLERK